MIKIDNKSLEILINSAKDYFDFLRRLDNYNDKIVFNEPDWEEEYLKTDAQKWANAVFSYNIDFLDNAYDDNIKPITATKFYLKMLEQEVPIVSLNYPGVGKWKIFDEDYDCLNFFESDGVEIASK